MRFSALTLVFLGLVVVACGTTEPAKYTEFDRPNDILAQEIQSRIDQIPYKTYQDLLLNLAWLTKRGQDALPFLLVATEHDNPKMRSSVIWTIGRIMDIRTVPYLKRHLQDPDPEVRLEAATALITMNDDTGLEVLVKGLGNETERYRHRCAGILRDWAKREFGYDHRVEPEKNEKAIKQWMAWCNQVRGHQVFPVEMKGAALPANPPE